MVGNRNYCYLMKENEAYEGCKSINLGEMNRPERFFVPPWETAESSLDDVVDECVSFQLRTSIAHSFRIDDEGRFFITDRNRKRLSNLISVNEILESLRRVGYIIREDYWSAGNRQRIRTLKESV